MEIKVGYKIAKGVVWVLMHILFRFRVEGKENEVKEGGVFVCPNHLSNWDPPAVAIALKRPLTFMAKASLFKFKPFGALIRSLGAFPFQRGGGDVGALKTTMKLIREERPVIIFPEGRRMKPGMKVKVNTGLIRLAIKTGAPILPVGVDATYRIFSKVTIRIGKPMTFEEYKGKAISEEELHALGLGLMQEIYRLAGKEYQE